MKSSHLLVLFVTVCLNVIGIENSVIPLIENFKCIENLEAKKYTKNQFEEITHALSQKDEAIRLVSFNILMSRYDDTVEAGNKWPDRIPRIIEVLTEMQPDIICVQELYQNQLNDVSAFFFPDYGFYTKPAKDGELNGIFYKKARFKTVECKVWDAAGKKITLVHLRDKRTGKEVAVFNTHFCFSKVDQRESEATVMINQSVPFAKKMAVILTGDMNTFPNRPEKRGFPFFDGDYIHRLFMKARFRDAREMALLGHLGPISTFTNEEGDAKPFKGLGTPGVFLDHIYVSDKVNVLIHAVQPGTVNGYFPSDHMPILIDFIIQ